MSSSESAELKGGHAPAEKIAGGVRIARKEKPHNTSESSEPTPEPKGEEVGEEADNVRESSNVLAQSGLAAQTKLDYPEEAVKHTHEKPGTHPTIPFQPINEISIKHRKNHQLFQPRKH